MNRTERIEAVAIGASADGVEALGLLRTLPARFTPAILVVVHIPPDRSSLLPQLFGHRCVLSVKEAKDKEPVEPGTVYLAPPGSRTQALTLFCR